MTDKILFVDDEPFILNSLKRELALQFLVDSAPGGAEGLEKIARDGPYAVVVADYRMPLMNGIQFLSQVMTQAPDTVRMMLSGNADLQIAVEAVNEGQIFRFLTKPCEHGALVRALEAGIAQHRLITAEKELLEKTLVESINMLTDILSIVNPKAYGKSYRIREFVHFVCRQMNLPNSWQYEMAASLSQLGWIIFPPELLDKIAQHMDLSASEALLFSRHPITTRKLLEKIPRLELIAHIIEGQNRSIEDLDLDDTTSDQYFVNLGSHILNICVEIDQLVESGMSPQEAINWLRQNSRKYKMEILDTLGRLKSPPIANVIQGAENITIDNLEVGMLIAEAVVDASGAVLVEKNAIVTRSIIVQLYRLSSRPGFGSEQIKIIRPKI